MSRTAPKPRPKEPTVLVTLPNGKIIDVDESIAPLVKLLNDNGYPTVASCSGHGYRPGSIILKDERFIVITRNRADWNLIDALFPDIHGNPRV